MNIPCESDKRYRKQMLFWAVIYCSVTYASIYILKTFEIEPIVLRTLIALLPIVPIIWAGRNVLMFIRSQDEFQQKIQLEAVVFSAMTTAFLTASYGFLEGIGYPKLDTIWVLPMLGVLWVIGQVLARRRYL